MKRVKQILLAGGIFFALLSPLSASADTTLTLVKEVINNDGGTDVASSWLLFAAGLTHPEESFIGEGPVVGPYPVSPGSDFTLWEENGPSGYESLPWECDGGIFISPDTIVVGGDEQVTCTKVSDDITPQLTLIKQVDGGPDSPHDWQLSASGVGGFVDFGDSNTSHPIKANVFYQLSESGPANYTASDWTCDRGGGPFLALGKISIDIGQSATCIITNTYSPPTTPDPVIIIPGILGSWQKNGEWLIDPVFHTYDNLIDTLEANGYVLEETLFPFPYDWERSNILTAVELQEKIEDVRSVCNCSKVDVVAHSMGGLVARQYVESNYYQNDVDQLIFLATPHLGAVKTYRIWEAGDVNTPNPSPLDRIFDLVAERIYSNEARDAGFDDVFDFIRNKPVSSVQELLPTFDYLYPAPQNFLLQYPNGYPRNTFLENLNAASNLTLLETRTRVYNTTADSGNVTPISYSVIASDELPKWEHGKPIATQFGPGDGTVPKVSAEFLGADRTFNNTNHNLIASTSAAYVFKTLTGNEPAIIVGNIYDESDIDFNLLFIKLLSPIDMQIVAPDGKQLGKDLETGEELDEIPGAFYSGFLTDNEYAVIVDPLPGKYKIKTVGTDNGGEYTIVADYIHSGGSTEAETSGTTAPEQIIENTLTLSAGGGIEIEMPDTTPPEATISAGILTKDLVVTGLDNVSSTTVTKAGNTTIITDEADNKTTLTFKKIWNGNLLTYARLLSIQYGTSAPVALPSSFAYLWDTRTNPASLLSQTVLVDKTFAIQATYDKRRNKTTIIVLKKNTPIQTAIVSGLAIIKLTTDKGILKYSW